MEAKIVKDNTAATERTQSAAKQATEKPRSVAEEPRDYKRRRPSYRGKSGGHNAHEALRELLANQMLDLSQVTGRELAKELNDSHDKPNAWARGNGGRTLDWTAFTDPLAVRDMDRQDNVAERKRYAYGREVDTESQKC